MQQSNTFGGGMQQSNTFGSGLGVQQASTFGGGQASTTFGGQSNSFNRGGLGNAHLDIYHSTLATSLGFPMFRRFFCAIKICAG